MQKITWKRMLELNKMDISPLSFQFQLTDPTDEQGDICFRVKEVVAIQGKKAVVRDADDGDWLAVSAKQVHVQAV
jgi:hypothetical protein